MEGAESTVTVSLERVHAECLGQGEGLDEVDFGWRALQWLAANCNLTKEVQGVRLIAPFVMCTGERQRPFGKPMRFFKAAGQQLCFPKSETTECLVDHHFRC